MHENAIAQVIVDAGYRVFETLGLGLLESVYEGAMAHELTKRGMHVDRQLPVPVVYDGQTFDEGFRLDLLVADKVIVELKSVEKLAPVHYKQLLTYCRLMDRRLGLLMNFGGATYKDNVKRVVNGLEERQK